MRKLPRAFPSAEQRRKPPLVREQPVFAFEPAAVTGERSVRADHAVSVPPREPPLGRRGGTQRGGDASTATVWAAEEQTR